MSEPGTPAARSDTDRDAPPIEGLTVAPTESPAPRPTEGLTVLQPESFAPRPTEGLTAAPAESRDAPPIEIGQIDLSAEPATEPTSRRSPVRRIVLSSLLALTLAGAVAAGWTAWRIISEKDATLSAPETIGTLRLDKTEDGLQTADYLQTALSAEVDLDEAIGAVYSDGAGKNVLFLGGTGLIWSPEGNLDKAFGLITDKEGAVTDLREVTAGPLGGTMKCGLTKSDDGDLTVCGWADHGSLALAMFTNRSTADAAVLLREIRTATEKR